MSDTTKIQWADHTGGPWLICSMVSAGCKNCYAMLLMLTRLGPLVRKAYKAAGFEDWATRPIWGDKATRVLSKGFWNDARRLNAAHAKAGTRGRWFPSMIDWLDDMPAGIIDQDGNKLDPIEVLAMLAELIFETQSIDWLLLTKRPDNALNRIWRVRDKCFHGARPMMQAWLDGTPPPNVWFGFSAENQECFDLRWAKAKDIPAAVMFCSFEPLLGPIIVPDDFLQRKVWPILGGESGPGARPCEINWLRDLLWQFQRAGLKSFVKQIGAHPILDPTDTVRYRRDKKGGSMDEWPEDLRVRQFPDPVSPSAHSAASCSNS